jgi:hypothetical protein
MYLSMQWLKRSTLVSASIIVSACQTTGTGSIQQAYSSFPPGCYLRAPIPVYADVRQIPEFFDAMKRAGVNGPGAAFIASTPDTGYRVICACSDSWDMTKTTKTDAEGAAFSLLKWGEWIVDTVNFDSKAFPPQAHFKGHRDSFAGELVIEGRDYHAGQCVMHFSVETRKGNSAAAEQFLTSIDQTRASGPIASTSDRLHALDKLLEQRLITPEEHQSKRRTILDSL